LTNDLFALRERLERSLRAKLQELERATALLDATVADVRSRLVKDGPVRVWLIGGPVRVQGLGARVDALCGEVVALQDAIRQVADQQARQAAKGQRENTEGRRVHAL